MTKAGEKSLPASLASLAADTDRQLVAVPIVQGILDDVLTAKAALGERSPLRIDARRAPWELRYPLALATVLAILPHLPLSLTDLTDLIEQEGAELRAAQFLSRLMSWLSAHLDVLEQLVQAGLFEPREMSEDEQRKLAFLTDVRRHYDLCEPAEQKAGGDRMRMMARHNGTGADLWRGKSGGRHMDESIRAMEEGRRVAS